MSQYLHKAITIACEAHQGQSSINGEPYILHPLRLLIKAKSNDERIIAILHDVIEKTNTSLADLKNKGFDQNIISSIDSLSRRGSESYIEYIERLMQNKISVKRLIQNPLKQKKYASIIMISHKSKDKNLKKCINSLSKKSFIVSKPKFIRIEEI